MKIAKFYEEEWETRKAQKFLDYSRNKVLENLVLPASENSKALDLACGNGVVSEFLMSRNYGVFAIDISKEAITQVKGRGIKHAFVGNIEKKLPFKSSKFDLVFWGDNIEHVLLPGEVLSEIKRVLAKRGKLVISTPNMGYLWFRWHYFKTGEIPRTEGLVSEPWEWKHIRFFNKGTLTRLLHLKGFRVSRITGTDQEGLLSKLFPTLFCPILLVVAVKK